MSISVVDSERYPGCDYSLSQLLHTAKKKLHDSVSGGGIATAASQIEMDSLEQDALEVLSLVRSLKNSIAPINRIPPEVLSLVPDYRSGKHMDRDLIALTHVCRSWRETFTSRSSLWTRLPLKDTDKTRAYIQRSKCSPLKISLHADDGLYRAFRDAIPLIIPNIRRFQTLFVRGETPPDALKHFCCHTPLLEELDVSISGPGDLVLDSALFNGDLSSLRKLTLGSSASKVVLRDIPYLDSAPLLHTILLEDSLPKSSDAPPERTVPLPRLNVLSIDAGPVHSILLNHLHVPEVVSLAQVFEYGQGVPPILDNLPRTPADLGNLAHIATVNLCFDSTQKFLLTSGPSGRFRAVANLAGHKAIPPHDTDPQFLRYLSPVISTARGLAVSEYRNFDPAGAEQCPAVLQTLSSAKGLQTLVLVQCNTLPFIFALDPTTDSSDPVACPCLGELILYIESWGQFHAKRVISMAKNRASRGAGLSSITVSCPQQLVPGKEMFKLRKYVAWVEYRVGDGLPAWDDPPGGSK